MSITFQIEKLTGRLAGEIDVLGEEHGAEFTYHREVKGTTDIDWGYYFSQEAQGWVNFFTARDGAKLVGYVVNYAGKDRHYRRITRLRDDTFYLAPEYRGTRLGISFLLAAEREREATKVDILGWVNKAKSDYEAIWLRMGYVKEEIHYTKINPQRGA